MIPTRDLAIFASIVGVLNGAWVLYTGLVRDRARVVVRVAEANALGAGNPVPMLMVTVSNRGRRPVQITHVTWVASARAGTFAFSQDILGQLPITLGESESKTFGHGHMGGYAHGTIPLRRWFATDGAGRIHPLRERYRQRLEGWSSRSHVVEAVGSSLTSGRGARRTARRIAPHSVHVRGR